MQYNASFISELCHSQYFSSPRYKKNLHISDGLLIIHLNFQHKFQRRFSLVCKIYLFPFHINNIGAYVAFSIFAICVKFSLGGWFSRRRNLGRGALSHSGAWVKQIAMSEACCQCWNIFRIHATNFVFW